MNKEIDCRSEEGITIGLIDSIITSSRVLRDRLKKYHVEYEKRYQKDIEPNYYLPPAVFEALKDLHADNDLYFILQAGPFNVRIHNEDSMKLYEAIIRSQNMLIENAKEPFNTLAMYDAQWLEGQINLLGDDMKASIDQIEAVKFRIDAMKKHYKDLLRHLNNEK